MRTRLLIIFTCITLSLIIVADNFDTQYAYAACAAPLLGPAGPCFDSFTKSHEPLTERSIMESLTTNIEMNYDSWQMSDRNWPQYDTELKLPAIICTEFVADGFVQYRMAEWVDVVTISSFENHKNDFLCDRWLSPIKFEYEIMWDKSYYLPNGTGILTVVDNEMNLDDAKTDVFEVHVWSDTDHKGIQLIVTETDKNTGVFTGKVFFTTNGESSGTSLLVEDAVHANHKKLYKFSRISSEGPPLENENQYHPTRDSTFFYPYGLWIIPLVIGLLVSCFIVWEKKFRNAK